MARNADLSDISGEKTRGLECCREKNLVSPGWQLMEAVRSGSLSVLPDRLYSSMIGPAVMYRQHYYVWPKETKTFTYWKEANSHRMSNNETEHSTSFVLV